ncbi:hypothetical protein V7S43_010603 [Phytophthora oleae]|uniref:Uncharacterized protein n=1 Tax=Phytophthora oleae TaxID=2107226 RepID=A0ABD3FD95_9STRA
MLDLYRYSATSGLADHFTACDVVSFNIQALFTADTALADVVMLLSDEWTELQGSDIKSRFHGLVDELAMTEAAHVPPLAAQIPSQAPAVLLGLHDVDCCQRGRVAQPLLPDVRFAVTHRHDLRAAFRRHF